ncbi:acyltransferase-like [Apium graveolens]|uniref:acyltransferase-like n=1 Tax=Apium graveolens TaxID=4045 RepID=UPI003D7A5604
MATVISRSITCIKPASPTPESFKRYNLPLHDRLMPTMFIPAIFFYPSINNSADRKSTISDLLKNSLSETLSRYYLFAGRLRSSGSYVDCNDEGVQFVEAQIGSKLSCFLERAPAKEDEEGLGNLFPPRSIWDTLSDDKDSSLMRIQLNNFTCGGIALAVSLSHHMGDALTLFSFITYWASLSRHSCDHQKLVHICPHFVYDLLPQSHVDDFVTANVSFPKKHWITKEMVFHNSSIEKLKANVEFEDKLQGEVEQNYTRNELLTALLYRCAVAAAAKSNSGVYKKSFLCQAVNMRPMLDPPLPLTSLGNFISFNPVPTSTENETELNLLVKRLRKGKMQLRGSKGMDEHIAGPILEKYVKSNHVYYGFTSFCNFPVYEMDFGWGRPVRATVVDMPVVNSIIMMDTLSGDGIKAIVGLEEKEMEIFETDKELLTYGSF